MVQVAQNKNMIVYNAVECLECGDILHSKHRHDFQVCKCGKTGCDGGLDYLKRMGNSYKDLSLNSDSDHELIREKAKWGRNYDKDKNLLPQTEWILIKDIAQDHLETLLEYTVSKPINKIFLQEKKYRDG